MAVKPAAASNAAPVTVGCYSCKKTDAKLSQCARCHIAQYCSKECQKTDWPVHKTVCVAPAQKEEKSSSLLWQKIEKETAVWLTIQPGPGIWDMYGHREARIFPLLEQSLKATETGKLAYDLGCGNGATTMFLLKKGWRVIAIDTSQICLDLVETESKRAGIDQAKLRAIKGNVEEYAFTEKADLIVANDILPYIHPQKVKSLWDKIQNALEKDGDLFGTLFERGGMSEQALKMLGAWFVDNKKMVEQILEESKYKIEAVRNRPKQTKSNIIEFHAKKSAPKTEASTP